MPTNFLTNLLPPKVRAVLYALLAIVSAVQTATGIIPGGVWAKIVSGVTAAGLALALGNTPAAPDASPAVQKVPAP